MWTSQQREALKALGIDAELFLDLPDVSQGGKAQLCADDTVAEDANDELVSAHSPQTSLKNEPEPPATSEAQNAAVMSETAAQSVTSDVHPTQHLYKLGPWALEFSRALPVGRYPWINDLASYIGSKPSLISAAGEKLVQVNCDAYARESLNVDEKKALWALLKPALEQGS